MNFSKKNPKIREGSLRKRHRKQIYLEVKELSLVTLKRRDVNFRLMYVTEVHNIGINKDQTS